jgi:DNA-binding transcriptional regulator YiaG
MPNIAQVLKQEIARIARKQSRAEIASLKKSLTRHRTDIAALKRHVTSLVRQVSSTVRRTTTAAPASDTPAAVTATRFSAKRLAAHRRRLGLSAADMGVLLGVSGQSVYLWESGKARPRTQTMPAIAALRTLSPRLAASVLESRR